MIALSLGLALLTGALAVPPPTDLDGDGKAEVMETRGELVRFGTAKLQCGGDSFPCEIEVHDIASTDRFKEVAVCATGPRDDRSCEVYRYDNGKLTALPLRFGADSYGPGSIETKGNGILLAHNPGRIYTRIDKFLLNELGALIPVAQPAWYVGQELAIDRSVPITQKVGGGPVVANIAPKSTITLLVEDCGQPGHFLVRISSGLTGWVSQDALIGASDALASRFAAG